MTNGETLRCTKNRHQTSFVGGKACLSLQFYYQWVIRQTRKNTHDDWLIIGVTWTAEVILILAVHQGLGMFLSLLSGESGCFLNVGLTFTTDAMHAGKLLFTANYQVTKNKTHLKAEEEGGGGAGRLLLPLLWAKTWLILQKLRVWKEMRWKEN